MILIINPVGRKIDYNLSPTSRFCYIKKKKHKKWNNNGLIFVFSNKQKQRVRVNYNLHLNKTWTKLAEKWYLVIISIIVLWFMKGKKKGFLFILIFMEIQMITWQSTDNNIHFNIMYTIFFTNPCLWISEINAKYTKVNFVQWNN